MMQDIMNQSQSPSGAPTPYPTPTSSPTTAPTAPTPAPTNPTAAPTTPTSDPTKAPSPPPTNSPPPFAYIGGGPGKPTGPVRPAGYEVYDNEFITGTRPNEHKPGQLPPGATDYTPLMTDHPFQEINNVGPNTVDLFGHPTIGDPTPHPTVPTIAPTLKPRETLYAEAKPLDTSGWGHYKDRPLEEDLTDTMSWSTVDYTTKTKNPWFEHLDCLKDPECEAYYLPDIQMGDHLGDFERPRAGHRRRAEVFRNPFHDAMGQMSQNHEYSGDIDVRESPASAYKPLLYAAFKATNSYKMHLKREKSGLPRRRRKRWASNPKDHQLSGKPSGDWLKKKAREEEAAEAASLTEPTRKTMSKMGRRRKAT